MGEMPSPQCEFCANLSISHLIDLAQQESPPIYTGDSSQIFYQHHGSLADLEMSAQQGCELCRLIIEYLKGAEKKLHGFITRWTGATISDEEESAYSLARDLPRNHVTMCITASHMFAHSTDEVLVYDRVIVQIGDMEGPDSLLWDTLTPLAFKLTTPRGMSYYTQCR